MSQRIPVKELTDSFRGRAVGALADDQLRTNFRVAMDSLMKKRADAFPDEEEREGLRELSTGPRPPKRPTGLSTPSLRRSRALRW